MGQSKSRQPPLIIEDLGFGQAEVYQPYQVKDFVKVKEIQAPSFEGILKSTAAAALVKRRQRAEDYFTTKNLFVNIETSATLFCEACLTRAKLGGSVYQIFFSLPHPDDGLEKMMLQFKNKNALQCNNWIEILITAITKQVDEDPEMIGSLGSKDRSWEVIDQAFWKWIEKECLVLVNSVKKRSNLKVTLKFPPNQIIITACW